MKSSQNFHQTNSRMISQQAIAPLPHMVEISQSEKMNALITRWSDGQETAYPYVWLRDNCQCPECYNPTASQRLILIRNLDVDVTPSALYTEDETLRIRWSDGHKSEYDFNWLYKRRFASDAREENSRWLSCKVKPWGSDIQLPTGDFTQIMKDDMALLNWIEKLEEYGLFLVKNTPAELGQLDKLGKRIGILRETNYGYTFHVESKVDPSNVAFTGKTLGLHTDLPYYMYPPGLQILHCIKQVQTMGGDNELADGFMAAIQLRKENPEYFHLLSSRELNYHDQGIDHYNFYKMTKQPVIRVSAEGEVWQINYNNQARDSFLSLPPEEVHDYYKALKKFDELLYHERNLVRLKLQPGDMMCFHNYRVLHGRAGYDQSEGGERLLEGAFFDWDVLHSRRRVILRDHSLQP